MIVSTLERVNRRHDEFEFIPHDLVVVSSRREDGHRGRDGSAVPSGRPRSREGEVEPATTSAPSSACGGAGLVSLAIAEVDPVEESSGVRARGEELGRADAGGVDRDAVEGDVDAGDVERAASDLTRGDPARRCSR